VENGNSTGDGAATTRWTTSDRLAEVEKFYRDRLRTDGWKLTERTENSTEGQNLSLLAERDGVRLTVTLPQENGTSSTNTHRENEFELAYQLGGNPIAQSSPTPSNRSGQAPQPGDPDFIGPVPSGNGATPSRSVATPSPSSSDRNQIPAELQAYVEDLRQLRALQDAAGNSLTGDFKPLQSMTRREYARWLVATNNLIYANQPARQIREGVASDQPAFQDVRPNDPDFAAIQGLANAGLIPSPLSGDSTTVTFRPNAALTREDLILWKVPIDLRQALPNASIDAVQQTWGFQDTAKINPKALRAVLADYQNSDFSNIRRAFGYTTLFNPKKAVTRAEAAAVLWYFGSQGEGLSARDALQSGQTPASPTPSQSSPIPGQSPAVGG
jgi:hypothetical protein